MNKGITALCILADDCVTDTYHHIYESSYTEMIIWTYTGINYLLCFSSF